MQSVIITRPDYDIATRYGSYYYIAVGISADYEGFEVMKLNGEHAIKPDLIEAIARYDPILISGVGHGNANVYTGQHGNILMEVGDNDTAKIAEGRHFVLLSCQTGKRLLPWLVEKGAVACQGYDEDFVFVCIPENFPNSYAHYFFNAHNEIELSLHKGMTHDEAYAAAQKKWEEAIAAAPERLTMYLLHNKKCHKLWGDGNARITEETPPEPPEPPIPPEQCPYWNFLDEKYRCTNSDCIKCSKICKCEDPGFWKCLGKILRSLNA